MPCSRSFALPAIFVLFCAANVLAALLASGSALAATPGWQPAETVGAASDPIADVAIGSGGEAAAAFVGADDAIQVALAPLGGSFATPADVSSRASPGFPGTSVSYPRVAMNAAGDTVVAWLSATNAVNGELTEAHVQAAYRAAGGSFGAPLTLSTWRPAPCPCATELPPEGLPAVAIDAGGTAVVAWQAFDGTENVVQAAAVSASGAGPAASLSSDGAHALEPAVAIDTAGEALIAWPQYTEGGTSEQAAVMTPAGSFGAAQELGQVSQYSELVDPPAVAMDQAGEALVLWERESASEQDYHTVSASLRPAGAPSFDAPVDVADPRFGLSAGTYGALLPALAMDPAGDAVAVWELASSAANEAAIQTALMPAGGAHGLPGAFYEPEQISDVFNWGLSLPRPLVAIGADGQAWAVWEELGSPSTALMGAVAAPGEEFTSPSELAQAQDGGFSVDWEGLAADASGDAIAIYFSVGEGGREELVEAVWYLAPSRPDVVTGAVGGVGESGAVLAGTVNPEGSPVSECFFEWGTSTGYGQKLACEALPGEATEPVSVKASLSGLKPDTSYHYRLIAVNAGGLTEGKDATFTTQAPPPPVKPEPEPEPEPQPRQPVPEPKPQQPAPEPEPRQPAPEPEPESKPAPVQAATSTPPPTTTPAPATGTPPLTVLTPHVKTPVCASERSFTLHVGLGHARELGIISARVWLDGHPIARLTRPHLATTINLHGLPKRTVTIRITAQTRSHHTLHGTRTYHTCIPALHDAKRHEI